MITDFKLEIEDLRPILPEVISKVREAIESEKFITYPQGIMEHYGISKPSAWRLWTKKGFPQVVIEETGVKGVYLHDLKRFEKINR